MSDTWSNYSLNGCLFEDTPQPAPTLNASSAELPQLIDLRRFCPPVEDQLKTNSCVANAVVGALEFHQIKARLNLTDISRLFVYYNARSLSESEHQDTGSFIHHGMAAILAYGGCEARLWPFEQAMVTAKPTAACYQNASQYEAVQYARTPRGVPALTALAQGLPVVFGMYAPHEYYQAAAQTGVMPKPDQVVTQSPPSGHAMLIVGYDLSDKTYLVRNSWGAGWADQGYCKIPFETMEVWARPEDFWTIGAIEQATGFERSGPSMIEAMKSIGVEAPLVEALGKKVGIMRSDIRSRLSSNLDAAKRDFRSRIRGE
ncbi:MAG: C1 family peptidase [Henriciella sp.]